MASRELYILEGVASRCIFLPDPFDDHEIGFVIMVGLMFYMEVTYEVPIFARSGGGDGSVVFWMPRRSCGRHLSDHDALRRWQMFTRREAVEASTANEDVPDTVRSIDQVEITR